jgi:hypothetical protein
MSPIGYRLFGCVHGEALLDYANLAECDDRA